MLLGSLRFWDEVLYPSEMGFGDSKTFRMGLRSL